MRSFLVTPVYDCYPARYKTAYRNTNKFQVGVEFEIEGTHLPDIAEMKYHWRVTSDGSLRGPHAEYVLKSPMSYAYFKTKAMPYLTKWINRKKSKLAISQRCSTHVHINCLDMPIYQTLVFGILYYAFESFAFMLAGEEREGNLFCLGSTASPAVVSSIIGIARNHNSYAAIKKNSEARYTAVNFHSLYKYGSLEFRAMEGSIDRERVYTWIDFLLCLQRIAKETKLEDVPTFLERISRQGPSLYFMEAMSKGDGRAAEFFRKQNIQDMDTIIYEGIWSVQEFFYGLPWETYKNLKPYHDGITDTLKTKISSDFS